jgi:N-acetylglutamate synthase-like GNAT family acetyltransferase
MAIEVPLPRDELWIRQLLILCDLPQEDLTPEHLRHFLVLKEKGQVIGLVGVEIISRRRTAKE